jgi:hypothetical protein
MDAFKIENFRKDDPSKKFPWFETLTLEQCQKIRTELFAEMKIPKELKGPELARAIDQIQTPVAGFLNEKGVLTLEGVLKDLGIDCENLVHINWKHFDDIDRFEKDELFLYFFNIWYPSSDDIDIFDSTGKWLLSVDHGGGMKIIKKPGSN